MKISITFALLFGFVFTFAQCPPVESFLAKKKEKDDYNLNSQSRVGAIDSEKSYEMSFIAHPGLDYRLTTVLGEGSAGTLTYEIYELVVEKKLEGDKEVFKKVKKVLATSGSEPLEFISDKARKIFVTVSINGGDKKKHACVGVVIETKRSIKKGF